MDNVYFLSRRMDMRIRDNNGRMEREEFCEAETMTLFNPDYAIDVDFAGKFFPSLSVDVRVGDEPFVTPESTVLNKVLPVSQSEFDKQFDKVFKLLRKAFRKQSEFYLVLHSDNFIELFSFCNDKIHHESVRIDFRKMSYENSISVSRTNTNYGRALAKRKGKGIEASIFKNILKLCLTYISRTDKIVTENERFVKEFEAVLSGKEYQLSIDESYESGIVEDENQVLRSADQVSAVVDPVVEYGRRSIDNLTVVLEARINSIKNRLCNCDDDTKEVRESLRGEIRGLQFAIKKILEK